MSKKIKKYVLPYFPYLIAFWFFSKCGTAYRMAAGANLGEKLFGMVKTIGPVFQSYAYMSFDASACKVKHGTYLYL